MENKSIIINDDFCKENIKIINSYFFFIKFFNKHKLNIISIYIQNSNSCINILAPSFILFSSNVKYLFTFFPSTRK